MSFNPAGKQPEQEGRKKVLSKKTLYTSEKGKMTAILRGSEVEGL